MNSLFMETSAKADINVAMVFQQVVQKILDTPELWEEGDQRGGAGGKTVTSGGKGGVPGGVQVVGLGEEERVQGGCEC